MSYSLHMLRAMNCIFCHQRPDGRRLTREHVFSTPIRRAFDIADDTQIGRIDMDGTVLSFARADQFAVRLPCGRCNSGWMSSLDLQAAKSLRRWQSSGDRLGRNQASMIMRWCLKTYIVLSAVEGSIRTWPKDHDSPAWSVMPEATRARMLAQEEEAAFDGVRVGASLVKNSLRIYAFGNPKIQSPHGGITSNVSAGASFVTLGNLRLWTVVAFDRDAQIRLPPGVIEIRPHFRYRNLRSIRDSMDVSDAVVINSRSLDEMAALLGSVAGRPSES